MTSFYDELGVDRGADAEQIKAAYRRRARETHPDTGGKREDFQRVQAAYDVLGDEKKRAYYDATGSAGAHPGDAPTSAEMLLQAFAEILAYPQPRGFVDSNPLVRTRTVLEAMAHAIRDDVVKMTREESRLKKMLARLHRRGHDEPLLEGLIESKMVPVTAGISRGKLFCERIAGALALLAGYTFKSDGGEAPELVFSGVDFAVNGSKRRPRR